MNPKFTSKVLSTAALVLASSSFTQAASIIVNTVGVTNTNNHTIIDAAGSLSNATFASSMTTAFANNTGGVWNFDTTFSAVSVGDTITLNYGTSLTESLVMTLGGTNGINTGFITTAEATSGTQGMGLDSNASTRTFTLSKPLLSLGMYIGNRGDNSRVATLTVTYQDTTTTIITGGTAGPAAGSNYFQGVAASASNPIVSFSLAQTNFIRYDDLGFVVAPAAVPEPASAATLVGLGVVGFAALRRRRSKA